MELEKRSNLNLLLPSLQEAVTCISGFDEVISNMLLAPVTGLKEKSNEH